MRRLKGKESVTKYKLLFMVIVLIAYMIGRSIPLYGVDPLAYTDETLGAEELLMQSIGGDTYRYSIFALGISPYIMSMLLVQIFVLLRNSDSRAKLSPKRKNRIGLAVTLIFASVQALVRINELRYTVSEGSLLYLFKAVALLEMIAGVMLVVWMSDLGKKYGIGGQSLLILFNISDGIISNLKGRPWGEMALPIIVSSIVVIIITLMENTEKRIPLQRVSIHNIYADTNYLAIKHNPAGMMPVMFSTAFFMIPRLLFALLHFFLPDNQYIIWWQANLVLTKPFGIAVYIGIVYLLNIGFSMAMINPKDITEQFLKSGDSIVNLHAGRDTKRYLTKTVLRISFFSATVMGGCLGIPLVLQLGGNMDSSLAMLPSSAMMLTGICCNFIREFNAIRKYDAYKQFIFT